MRVLSFLRWMHHRTAIGGAALALLTGPWSSAQAATLARDTAIDQVRLAVELARYGDRSHDPLALLMAARIQAHAGVRRSTARPIATHVPQPASAAHSVEPEALLSRAESYAGGRQDLLALINAERAAGSRGAPRGPLVDYALIPVGAVHRIVVIFAKGAKAVFGISGDNDADLDLEIVDAAGRPVCKTDSSSGQKQCDWVPEATGEYQIRVRNRAQLASEFTFFHN